MKGLVLTPEQRTHLQRAGLALGAVLLLVLGFSAGRFSAPAQVETREVERWRTLDIKTEDLTRGMTFAKSVEVTRWRNVTTTITVTPDAGTTTTITDRTVEREGTAESSSSTETKRTTEEHAGERDTEKTSTTTLQASWRIGAQVGASLQPPALPITGPLVVGVSVERRILGGVSAGLWANTVGAGGVSLSVEF